MARVTVEDCILRVSNRFDLVLVAAQRGRDIASGAPLTIDRDDDKNPVVSLREIADQTVAPDEMREAIIRGLQRHAQASESEEDLELLLAEDEAALSIEIDLADASQEVAEDGLTVHDENEADYAADDVDSSDEDNL